MNMSVAQGYKNMWYLWCS